MYNLSFIFEECGFDWLPGYIDRTLLFNTSFNTQTGAVKLYILDKSKRFLYKIDGKQIIRQTKIEDKPKYQQQLSDFFECSFDPQEIEVDTREGDVLYVFTEGASSRQFMRFANVLMQKYDISKSSFVQAVGRVNAYTPTSISDCWLKKLTSGFKVPLSGSNCKLYARPFNTGNTYTFNDKTLSFLMRLHDCNAAELPSYLEHLWVSSEFFCDRVMVTTQHHELLHL